MGIRESFTLFMCRFRKMDMDRLLGDGRLFSAWSSRRSGNVYDLLKGFIKAHGKCGDCEVWVYSVAWTPRHTRDYGVWMTYQKHQRWFKRWVAENGGGNKYGTYKETKRDKRPQ